MGKIRITSLMLAAMLFAGTGISCSSGSPESSAETKSQQLALKAAEIAMADNFSEIMNIDSDSSGNILIFGKSASGAWTGYTTDSTFSEYTDFTFTPDENEAVMSAAVLKYGKKAVLTYLDGATRIHIITSDGETEKVLDCGEILPDSDTYARLYQTSDEGFIISCDNMTISALGADGEYIGDIKTDSMSILGVTKNRDGAICCIGSFENKSYAAEVNASSLTLENKTECTYQDSTPYSICAGAGDYSIAAIFSTGLYGYKDGDWVLINDFMDLDLTSFSIYGLLMTGENEFAVLSTDAAGVSLNLLTESDISELKSKQVIKVATWMESDVYLTDMVKKYNSANADGDYRIEIVSYSVQGETIDVAMENMKMDMISGNCPDIVLFNGYMPIDTFGSKEDMFVDMYTFLDNDPDLSREDFFPNILEGLERDGKLLTISPTFIFRTVMAKSGYPGVKENWTVDDMIEAYASMPEGMDMFKGEDVNPRIMYFDSFVHVSDFVDYENAKCSFDSPEFIKLISFFNDNEIGLTWDEYTNLPNNSDYESDSSTAIRNNKVLVSQQTFWGFGHLYNAVKGEFDNEGVLAGYPSPNGSGSTIGFSDYEFGIMANSPNSEGAWDFIRTFFTDEFYELNGNGFPVIESRFNAEAEKYLSDWSYTDPETGEVSTGKWEYTIDSSTGESVELEPMTQEELEYYKNLIKSTKYRQSDAVVFDICHEEVMSFFGGECTAEQCAAMIQNRASLYLSEHYS